MSNPYTQIPDEETDNPPDYDSLPQGASERAFEQFEIDEETGQDQEDIPRSRINPREIFNKAGYFAKNLNARFFQPLNNALDPVYQLYRYINAKTESYISRVGNPMIIKRLLYVMFIATLIYIVSMTGIYPDTVGGNLYGDFYDFHKLHTFVDENIDVNRMQENLEYLSSMPHMSGTAGDLTLARYVREIMIQSALTVDKDSRFSAYTNYPHEVEVKLFNADGEVVHTCTLKEEIDVSKHNKRDGEENDSTANTETPDLSDINQLAFNPGSLSGHAKGHVVYVNYGMKSDYKTLSDKGIDVSGSIVIVKYGGYLEESKKVKYAHDAGAVGVLFISDPQLSSVYSMNSIQREPVASSDYGPGNIVRPGVGAIDEIPENANIDRLWEHSQATPKIPSLPISWTDFKAIMEVVKSQGERLEQWDVDFSDNGYVEIWTGSKDVQIELSNNLIQRLNKETWNVVGKISGSEQDNLAIVVGASRDSTCYGAIDSTGTAVLLEMVEIFSRMVHNLKWRPLRTIYFVSFSGTNYNLAGSSNFALQRSDYFRRQGYAYIDLSDAISGNELEISADPMLYSLIHETITQVNDPTTNNSMADSWDQNIFPLQKSDKNYLPFLAHFGMSTIEIKFKDKQNKNHPKNSCLDSFKNFQDKNIDPNMDYHKTLTSLTSKVILQLVEKPVIPYDIFSLVSEINKNSKDLRTYAELKMSEEQKGGKLDFAHFETSLIKLKNVGREQQSFIETWTDIVNADGGSEPNLLAVNRWDWNTKLTLIETIMLSTAGIYNRPWHFNVLFGNQVNLPEVYGDDGKLVEFRYGSFPGVRDAIEAGDWEQAQAQLDIVSELIDHCLAFFQLA